MKKVLSNNITTTARQPVTKVTLSHYTDALTELADALAKGLITDSATPTILYGCVNSASPNANITAGAVYYNGEIYLCDAFVDGAIAGVVVGTIATTYDGADPVLFSDGASYNVHQINKIVWSDAGTGTGTFDYLTCKTLNVSAPYVNITSGLTFKYVDDGGTLRTIVASPTLTIFKYRLIGKTCHLQFNISDIDTATSNSGVGHKEIQILGLPSAITPKTNDIYNTLISNSAIGATLASDLLVGKISGTTLYAQTVAYVNTTTSALNTRLFGEFTYEVA